MEFKQFQNMNWKMGFLIFGVTSSCFANLPDITLSPLTPLNPDLPSAPSEAGSLPEASKNPSAPTQEKVIDPPVPENRIEKYYSTSFADYFGPSPWVISSTP